MSGVTINGKQYGSIEEYMEEINPTIVEGDPKEWAYTVEPDGITLTEYLNEDKTIDTVVIPNYIGGVPVKRIDSKVDTGYAQYTIWNEKICEGRYGIGNSISVPGNLTIKKITIPNGVEVIGYHAFAETRNLENIVLPSTLLEVGNRSFYNCSSLTSLTIPNNVKIIGGNAFSSCSNLMKITIPDSVTSISYSAFSYCTNLTEITIPSSVTVMDTDVFYGIPSITVHVPWKKGEKPERWANNWNSTGSDCTITVDYAK